MVEEIRSQLLSPPAAAKDGGEGGGGGAVLIHVHWGGGHGCLGVSIPRLLLFDFLCFSFRFVGLASRCISLPRYVGRKK